MSGLGGGGARPMRQREETALSLIEDCLDQIYAIRKRSLTTKKEANRSDMEKRRQGIEETLQSPVRVRPAVVPFEEDDEPEEEAKARGQLVHEMSAKLKAPSAIAALKPSLISDPFQKPPGAAALLEEFEKVFYQIAADVEEDDEMDEECDRLTERFFVNGLDKLQPSQQVTAAKKKVAQMIEDLASGDLAKYRAREPDTEEADTSPPRKTKSVKFKEASPQSDAAASSSSSGVPAGATATGAPAVDKGASEKQRIKQQYESYMKLKRKNDQHRDVQKIKEIEDFNSDIQSVLAVLQTGPARS